MSRNTVQILGYGIDDIGLDDAVEKAFDTPGQIVTINPEMMSYGLKDSEFSNILKSAQLVVPDGIGVVLGLKILGHNIHRLPGIELGMALLCKASKENKKVAFVGAKEYIVNQAVKNLKSKFENLNVVYVKDGYFSDDAKVVEEVVNAQPDLVLVALGSPKQEFFIDKLKKELSNSVMIGLGGSFDVWAGVVKRAPIVYQRLGLEWMYRVLCEPKRISRIFPAIPLFLCKVLKERLSQNK